jgi:hypothetical protein
MTITTVGFGDIIPVTPVTRFLAAFEAVLGWTLAGFFLNAAAHRIGSGSVAHDSNITRSDAGP